MIWLVIFCAVLAFVSFVCGFVFAIVCYPDKQEIIDRIKRNGRA